MDLKWNKKLLDNKNLTTTWYNGKLHGSMTLGIHCVCTNVELISWRIKNNIMEDYVHKCNGRPFSEKKTMQNYKHYSRKKYRKCWKCLPRYKAKLKMVVKEWTGNKTFWLRNDHIGLDWEEINSYGQKHFRETNNRLHKLSTT